MATMPLSELIEVMELEPHVEGGYYKETFRDTDVMLAADSLPAHYKVGRPVSTAIMFLMPSGATSNLHRIPLAEVWHFYIGEPITVYEIDEHGNESHVVLGNDLAAGQKLQYVTKPMVWFGAYPTKDIAHLPKDGAPLVKSEPRDREKHYSLVGCTCAPAFDFADFELGSRSKLLAEFPHAKTFIEYLTHYE
jgi:hypothetical protein